METSLVKVEEVRAQIALEPRTLEEADWLAAKLAVSGVIGKAVSRPEAAFAVILAGRELGLTAMQSLRSIHVIEGKPTLSADLMVALCKRAAVCKRFKLVESTPAIATYETEREGEGVTRLSFSIEEARVAGLLGKDNWKKYPAAMLRARCAAALVRLVYPDVAAGLYDPDEIDERVADTHHVTRTFVEANIPGPVVSSAESAPPDPAPAAEAKPHEGELAGSVTPISQPAKQEDAGQLQDELSTRMSAAKSKDDLDAVAGEINQYVKASKITPEARKVLLKVYEVCTRRFGVAA